MESWEAYLKFSTYKSHPMISQQILRIFSTPRSGARDWFIFDYGVNWDLVKAIAMPILNRYTARTNGSSIRIRDPSVAWSYYRTDPEWGLMQARIEYTAISLAKIKRHH